MYQCNLRLAWPGTRPTEGQNADFYGAFETTERHCIKAKQRQYTGETLKRVGD